MAELEPGKLFVYGVPRVGAFLDAAEIENCLRALAQNHYTTDPAQPADARQGQTRVLADDPANKKWQVWVDGNWRTIFQHVEVDIPAPVKQIAQRDTPSAAWTVDHNLGSQPLVQVYDDSFRLITPFTQANPPTEQFAMGFVPQSVLLAASGPADLGAFVAPWDGFIVGAYLVVGEAITGTPTLVFQPTINGTPTTGGDISVSGPLATAAVVNGTTVTAANKFTAGQTVRVRLNSGNVAPGAGSVSLFLLVRKADHCFIQHVNENRVTVTHPEARTGFVVLIG